jgi:hypothetical protein
VLFRFFFIGELRILVFCKAIWQQSLLAPAFFLNQFLSFTVRTAIISATTNLADFFLIATIYPNLEALKIMTLLGFSECNKNIRFKASWKSPCTCSSTMLFLLQFYSDGRV